MPKRKPRLGAVSKPARPTSRYYGIRRGRDSFSGVVDSWPQCFALVNGIPGVQFRGFSSREEASAFSKQVPGERPTRSRKKNFYAIRGGANGFSGVVNTWEECFLYVKGAPGVKYKGFMTYEEALQFLVEETGEASSSLNMGAPAARLDNSLSTIGALEGARPPNIGESAILQQTINPNLCQVYTTTAKDEDLKRQGDRRLIVYTDGACTNNGRVNSMAGYGVFFGEDSPLNISKRLHGLATNQRAEMTAVLEAIRTVVIHELLKEGELLEIHTDSQYTKQGLDLWIYGWQRNGWKTSQRTDVKNKDLWMAMYDARTELLRRGILLKLIWVRGHAGNPGNEAADRLAVAGIHGST